MIKLDEQEVKIIRELIRNPRITDNQLAKRTNVPVMTVNRKRKKLEERDLIRYYASLRHEEEGTGLFHARELYIIKLKIGITREEYFRKLKADKELITFSAEHISESYIGEKDGHLALMMIVDAHTESELIESFNGKIVPNIKKNFGEDAIREVITMSLDIPIRLHHNYLPQINMEKGRIRGTWLDEWIFV
ncbi:Lrp/AsnC family transcriptional regulator [Candidatus Woesearchaeota archaeon]|nr:Lrp/AsnC family transcriptional regulator [Candidatus Woesearchaeota archaeon]